MKKQLTASEMGKRGGKARARNHSKKQLTAWARKGGIARQKKNASR